MQEQGPEFKRPSVLCKDDGSTRLVGFELEFSGISLEATVKALEDSLGARVTSATAAEQKLHADGLGDFVVEVDWAFLKRKAEEERDNRELAGLMDHITKAAALLVPIEVACPPIAICELDRLSPLVDSLRDAGAIGTEESLLSAYGVHINPEIPRLDAPTLQAYLVAFCLLQWWLVEAHQVDMSRRVSPYIRLYSEDYVKRLLSNRTPTMEDLFDDYLEFNPSRNRALDLLPLLMEIDEERVLAVVNDSNSKARPTFHYRLPNCQIERKDWSLANSWNLWWIVEELAHRPDDLESLGQAFLAADRPLLGVSREAWIEFVGQWLKDRALA